MDLAGRSAGRSKDKAGPNGRHRVPVAIAGPHAVPPNGSSQATDNLFGEKVMFRKSILIVMLVFLVSAGCSNRSRKWSDDTECWIEVKKDGTEIVHTRGRDGGLR